MLNPVSGWLYVSIIMDISIISIISIGGWKSLPITKHFFLHKKTLKSVPQGCCIFSSTSVFLPAIKCNVD